MPKKEEKGLILVKETPFEIIRRNLLKLFYGKDYKIMYQFEKIMKVNRPKDVIIPKEIK